MTLIPAYGRDYKSQKEVKKDWDDGKDFIIADVHSQWDGKYANKEDLVGNERFVMIRFAKLTKICVVIG